MSFRLFCWGAVKMLARAPAPSHPPNVRHQGRAQASEAPLAIVPCMALLEADPIPLANCRLPTFTTFWARAPGQRILLRWARCQ